MKLGALGRRLIQTYETGPDGGPALVAYLCPAGVYTTGWGHTKGVKKGDTKTLAECERDFEDDVAWAETTVNSLVHVPLNQNQFDALVSFVFNVGRGTPQDDPHGPSGFYGSTLLRLLNTADYAGAAEQFRRWDKGRVGGELRVLNGLVLRRIDERDLFTTPV